LKQGIRDIEYLADPTAGEIRIGCVESLSSAILIPVIKRFSQQYPRVALHLHRQITPSLELPELRDRSLDAVLARIMQPSKHDDDLNVEVLFDDHLVLAAGAGSRWASRREIDLAELTNELWTLTPAGSRPHVILTEAFRARGLELPRIYVTTFSVPLRANLVAMNSYISAFPNSVLRFDAEQFSLKALPVDLPVRPWPLAVVTLKNRTLSPLAQRFIDHVRAFASSLRQEPAHTKKSA
jgi:DNA-binding transcriptional LysR family regulator